MRPAVRISKIVRVSKMAVLGGFVFMLHGIGNRRIISKSNRINKIAIRKN